MHGDQKISRLDAKLNQGKKLGFGKIDANSKPDVGEHFLTDDFETTLQKIKTLSEECGMRRLNAQRASKSFKLFIKASDTDDMAKEEFVEFLIDMMKKYDFCDTEVEQNQMRKGFSEVFECFDYDKSGKLDAGEIANCLALMCGGSINEKIFAAFNLFDANDSMTLSFDELNEFIKCVFQIFYQIRGSGGDAVWDKVQMKKLTLATTEKCFQDNRLIKGKGEVNYTQFI